MISKRKIYIVLLSGLYLLIVGIVAWISGRPFIFPSLGPTAYVLAFDILPDKNHSAQTVIGGHACGVIGGLLSYQLLVSPHTLMNLTEPMSFPGIYLALGAVTALIITTFLMLLFNASHPPACATTLIISLGILPTLVDGLFIMGAVTLMYIGYLMFQYSVSYYIKNKDLQM